MSGLGYVRLYWNAFNVDPSLVSGWGQGRVIVAASVVSGAPQYQPDGNGYECNWVPIPLISTRMIFSLFRMRQMGCLFSTRLVWPVSMMYLISSLQHFFVHF